MFVRMFFVMFLTLFSTRLLLKTLGFEGYGIYDLIFGIVVLFNILSGSMATTLQRFYNISHNDPCQQSSIYSVSLYIFSVIGLLILFLGLSFSNVIVSHLNIPIYHFEDAVTFFKLCVLNLVFLIFRLPFIALIISNEKMGIYASISIFDAILKFLGVLFLSWLSLNISKIVLYGYILNIVTFIVTMFYIFVCYFQLNMPKIKKKIDKKSYKEILLFSGWTLFGSSAALFSQQGLSITLNAFFGVVINATNAIAQQVYIAVYQFVNSFQTAYTPYLMLTYAEGDYEKLKKLIVFFSKFSVFLYLLIAIPLFAFAEPILKLWLEIVPEYAIIFTRLTLLMVLFEVLSAPLWLTVQASGNIQRYQVIISLILILNLPIAYICFMVWKQPIYAFIAKVFTALLAYIYRVYSVRALGGVDFNQYIKELLFRLVILLIFIAPITYFYIYQEVSAGYEMILKMISIILFLIVGAFFILLNKNEYKIAIGFMNRVLKRFK